MNVRQVHQCAGLAIGLVARQMGFWVMLIAWTPVTNSLEAALNPSVSLTMDFESGAESSRIVVGGISDEVLAEAVKWTDAEWRTNFSIHLVLRDRLAPSPLLGDYSVSERKLVFAPRYPFRAGVKYRASLLGPMNTSSLISRDFMLPSPDEPQTRLTTIFPSGDILPENLLKFYLHFSAPMSRGEVYRQVQLVDQRGKRIEYPFLELAEELWSPDGKRLTLYFDPGRIKRGLKPRELFGPALLEGGSYSLIVAADWPDANGQPLAASVKKTFRVKAPDDVQPNINRWRITAPPADSRELLTVLFDEPLDSAMLARVILVRDAKGQSVEGEIEVAQDETRWVFRPRSKWGAGSHAVVAATTLEDLAGNSLGRPFEVDVFRPAPDQTETPTVSLPFVIAAGTGQ